MKRVFAGGSRRVTRLNADVRHRLDQIIQRQLCVLIGDANGADKAIQKYLSDCHYPNVVVFCTAGECRNNVGGWPVRSVDSPHKVKDFTYYTAKDAAMARESEFGLMLWDGESAGTMVNVARLVSAGKPVVLYVLPAKVFYTLKTPTDLEDVLSTSPRDVMMRVHRYITEHAREFAQPTIF
ncbi:MAG: hypothetical protein HY283_04260 [Nitrospirae bacterium]|nr:hypothetical protein [Nitrospirota bacterium]